MISSVDLARYGVSRAKDWVSVNFVVQYVFVLGLGMLALHSSKDDSIF